MHIAASILPGCFPIYVKLQAGALVDIMSWSLKILLSEADGISVIIRQYVMNPKD
jgi:hypothetical protein